MSIPLFMYSSAAISSLFLLYPYLSMNFKAEKVQTNALNLRTAYGCTWNCRTYAYALVRLMILEHKSFVRNVKKNLNKSTAGELCVLQLRKGYRNSVQIIFHIFRINICCSSLLESSRRDSSNEGIPYFYWKIRKMILYMSLSSKYYPITQIDRILTGTYERC